MLLSELIEKGGFVMILIILLSVYVTAIIIYKILQFMKYSMENKEFVEEIKNAIEDKNYSAAAKIADNNTGVNARILQNTVRIITDKSLSEEKKTKYMEVTAVRELSKFETHLRGLEVVANISPLLGLLGTVLGMVKAFAAIGTAEYIDPGALAGGIWEALLTTVAGLMVAIPALATYYIMDNKIENISLYTKNIITDILAKYDKVNL